MADWSATLAALVGAGGYGAPIVSGLSLNDVPTILIADAGGRVVRRIEGNAVQDGAALRRAIDAL